MQRQTIGGKEYLVAPMSLIVPGVLNGSKGALLYQQEHVSDAPHKWNRIPLTVRHPFDPLTNTPLSASDKGVWKRQGIGFTDRAAYNGRLQSYGYFDVERTKRIEPRIYNALVQGEKIELSTGLFTDNVPKQGNFNGKHYDYVAVNYRPDHVAILPDETGACSVRDGCGVNNKFTQPRYETGQFGEYGDVHKAADVGGIHLTDDDHRLGEDASRQLATRGDNPASWVKDEDTWEKAKAAASKTYDRSDPSYWAVTTHIYKNMGGAVATENVWSDAAREAAAAARKASAKTGSGAVNPAAAASAKANGASLKAGVGKAGKGSNEHLGAHKDAMQAHMEAAKAHGEQAEKHLEKGNFGRAKAHLDASKSHSNAVHAHAAEVFATQNALVATWIANAGYTGRDQSGQFTGGGEDEEDPQLEAQAAKEGMSVEELKDKMGIPQKGKKPTKNDAGEVIDPHAPAALLEPHGSRSSKDGRQLAELDEKGNPRLGGEPDDHQNPHLKVEPVPTDNKDFASDDERKAAFAHMESQSGPSKDAAAASGHADRIKSKGAHRAAASAHREAAAHHKENDNDAGHQAHTTAAKYHDRKAREATRNFSEGLTGDSTAHAMSKQAAAASLQSEHDKAFGHAQTAMQSSKDGDNDAASDSHQKAAAAHEKQATVARKGGDQMQADEHDQAAALHRKAASVHAATTNQEVSNMTRSQKLAVLTANCSCDKDKAALNSLSEESLSRLVKLSRNADGGGDDDEDDEDMETYADRKKAEGSNADVIPGKKFDQAGGEGVKKEYELSGNAKTWLAGAPKEIQSLVGNALATQKSQKVQIVRALIANVADEGHKRSLINIYRKMDIPQLRTILASQPTANAAPIISDPMALYLGAEPGNIPIANVGADGELPESETLGIPVINYQEMSPLRPAPARAAS